MMNSYLSWSIFLVITGGLTWYYIGRPTWLTRTSPQKPASRTSRQSPPISTRKSKSKAKQGEDGGIGREESRFALEPPTVDGSSNKKRKIAAPQLSGKATPSSSHDDVPRQGAKVSYPDKDVTNNADFARKMAVARNGTQLLPANKASASKKMELAPKHGGGHLAHETDSPSLSAGPSSTAGADADDDLSPAASPLLAAMSTAPAPKAADVSDMLESAGAGPSVIRLTGPTEPTTTAKPRQSEKAFERAETKKQRQQRLKREARQTEAAEVEKERRKKMEDQMRGARMAEKTSAQTRTSAFKPPTSNPWSSGSSKSSLEATGGSSSLQPSLLDTFDIGSSSKQSDAAEGSTTPVAAAGNSVSRHSNYKHGDSMRGIDHQRGVTNNHVSGKTEVDWARELPQEDEQLRLLQENEDAWTTVSKKEKKKGQRPQENKVTDVSKGGGDESHGANGLGSTHATSSRPAVANHSNSYSRLNDFGLQDSDWAAG